MNFEFYLILFRKLFHLILNSLLTNKYANLDIEIKFLFNKK